MAHREEVKNEQLRANLKGSSFYWNISAAVGWGCPNRQTDVMLVQYLLHRGLGGARPTEKPISMDGIFGPQTYKFIKYFQKEVTFTTTDGRVDAAGGTRDVSTKTKTDYTIHWLNVYLKEYKPVFYNDITIDNQLPTVLCNELLRIVVDDYVIAT